MSDEGNIAGLKKADERRANIMDILA